MQNKSVNIIQWNLNGFYKKIYEFKLIKHNHNPQIICLQETNFKNNHTATIKHYIGYSTNRTLCTRASGGVAIYIDTNIPSTQIQLKTNLEALAVTIHNKEQITICNIYLRSY